MINKGHWLEEGYHQDDIKTQHRLERDIVKDYGLTNREAQIHALLLEKKSYKEIADKLNISMPTAKTHILNLYRKLDVNKKSDLPGLYEPDND